MANAMTARMRISLERLSFIRIHISASDDIRTVVPASLVLIAILDKMGFQINIIRKQYGKRVPLHLDTIRIDSNKLWEVLFQCSNVRLDVDCSTNRFVIVHLRPSRTSTALNNQLVSVAAPMTTSKNSSVLIRFSLQHIHRASSESGTMYFPPTFFAGKVLSFISVWRSQPKIFVHVLMSTEATPGHRVTRNSSWARYPSFSLGICSSLHFRLLHAKMQSTGLILWFRFLLVP